MTADQPPASPAAAAVAADARALAGLFRGYLLIGFPREPGAPINFRGTGRFTRGEVLHALREAYRSIETDGVEL